MPLREYQCPTCEKIIEVIEKYDEEGEYICEECKLVGAECKMKKISKLPIFVIGSLEHSKKR